MAEITNKEIMEEMQKMKAEIKTEMTELKSEMLKLAKLFTEMEKEVPEVKVKEILKKSEESFKEIDKKTEELDKILKNPKEVLEKDFKNDKTKFKEYLDDIIETILRELKEIIASITNIPNNISKEIDNTKNEALNKANEIKTRAEKVFQLTKELFKDIDKDINKYKDAVKEQETIETETNKYNLSQMYSKFKPIGHISKETADLLIEINQGRENIMTIAEIKKQYIDLGHAVDAHKDVIKAFEKFEKLIRGLNEATIDYQKEVANTKAAEMEKTVEVKMTPEMGM